jgi:cytochrome c553
MRQAQGARRIAAGLAALIWLPVPASAEPQAMTVDSCVPCHGADGIAPDREVPHLAGQNEAYLYNQLLAFRSGKRRHKEMRYMARGMSDEEMRALAAYFASLPPR